MARSYLQRERADHTLQATALVHEAYLHLVDDEKVTWRDRAHFYGIAARMMDVPLGSRLRTDAWDDKVYTLKTNPVPLLNARDKMPFEVTPVYYKLVRYDQSQTAAASDSTQQQPAQPNQASAQPAAQPQQ